MGWGETARIAFPRGPMGRSNVIELTELSLTETVDEQEIENLLTEHSDSEYECQNDNELWTPLNFKVSKVNKFVVLYLSLYV